MNTHEIYEMITKIHLTQLDIVKKKFYLFFKLLRFSNESPVLSSSSLGGWMFRIVNVGVLEMNRLCFASVQNNGVISEQHNPPEHFQCRIFILLINYTIYMG